MDHWQLLVEVVLEHWLFLVKLLLKLKLLLLLRLQLPTLPLLRLKIVYSAPWVKHRHPRLLDEEVLGLALSIPRQRLKLLVVLLLQARHPIPHRHQR